MRKAKWDVLLQCCTWHLRLFYRRIIPQWCLLLLMAWTKSLSALNLEMCVTSCRPREREAPDANSSVWKLANWVVDFSAVTNASSLHMFSRRVRHGGERHDPLRLKFHMAFDMEFQNHGIHPFLDEFFACGHPETCHECTGRISDIKWTLHARSEEFFKSQFLKLGPAKFGIFIFQFATKSLVISYFCPVQKWRCRGTDLNSLYRCFEWELGVCL